MKLSCYVVDDEPLAVELMDGYVRKTPYIERGRVVFGKVRIPVSDTYRQGLHDFLGRHSVFL